jgi:phage tail tape-measure protein
MHKIYSIKGSIDTEAVRACVADGVKAAIDAMSDESLTEMMRAPLQDFAHQEQAAA